MAKEFKSLSEKKVEDFGDYEEKDIKEFIKETEKDMRNPKLSRMGMVEKFKKRAGDKLI